MQTASKQQTGKRNHRKSEQPLELSTKFRPRLLKDADGRYGVAKELKQRLRQLVEDCGADSAQKRMLCERAVFLAITLETQEANAIEGKPIDIGVYTQATNALSGLLTKLGLAKHASAVEGSLDEIIAKAR